MAQTATPYGLHPAIRIGSGTVVAGKTCICGRSETEDGSTLCVYCRAEAETDDRDEQWLDALLARVEREARREAVRVHRPPA